MELKKNPDKDLRAQSGMFLNIGLCITLGLTIFAFNYKSYEDKIKLFGPMDEDFEEVIEIPPTEMPPPPPPQIQQPEIIEVEDEEEIEEVEVEMDVEVTEESVVEEVIIEEEEEEEIEAPVLFAEQGAEPSGGMAEFMKKVMTYAGANYPERDKRAGITGRTFVQFVVEKDGSLSSVQIKQGTSLSKTLDAVAIKAVTTASPRWKPGKQGGRPVRQIMILPIKFTM